MTGGGMTRETGSLVAHGIRLACIIQKEGRMESLARLLTGILFLPALASAQDAMQYGLKHLRVLAEDGKVRVLKYVPQRGDKTPVHSHPSTVLYIVKGGKVRITMPDGSTTAAELKSGDALLRPPVTHSDEALDDLEVILIELKNQ
jgi:quercetin dioxygenase-like cupin family protein